MLNENKLQGEDRNKIMLSFFKKSDKQKAFPTKWKMRDLFTLDKGVYATGSNQVYKVEKTTNQHTWFYKTYQKTSNPIHDAHPYELEAIASELYRFILGVERAAKSYVITNDKNERLGVISAENPAGFKDIRKVWSEIRRNYFWGNKENKFIQPTTIMTLTVSEYAHLSEEEKESCFQKGCFVFINTGDDKKDDENWNEMIEIRDMYFSEFKRNHFKENYLTYDNGMAEMNMAMRILDEHDAGVGNLGLNNNNEVARIDYDFTLYTINRNFLNYKTSKCNFDTISDKSIASIFIDCESKINIDNRTAQNRFYMCQLMTLLQDDYDVISILCKRHTKSPQLTRHVYNLIHENACLLKESLYNSEGFIEFMKNIAFAHLKERVNHIFKYEDSNKTHEHNLLNIKNKFEQIKSEVNHYHDRITSSYISN